MHLLDTAEAVAAVNARQVQPLVQHRMVEVLEDMVLLEHLALTAEAVVEVAAVELVLVTK